MPVPFAKRLPGRAPRHSLRMGAREPKSVLRRGWLPGPLLTLALMMPVAPFLVRAGDPLPAASPSNTPKLAEDIKKSSPPAEVKVPSSSSASTAAPVADSEGKALYEQICAACHGIGGEGLPPVAPPLTNSSWVAGTEGRMIRIVLQGIQGPIHVNGTTYQPPRVLPEMPPLNAMEDAQISAVTSYIRQRWGGSALPVSAGKVALIRAETAKREKAWTEAELLQIK